MGNRLERFPKRGVKRLVQPFWDNRNCQYLSNLVQTGRSNHSVGKIAQKFVRFLAEEDLEVCTKQGLWLGSQTYTHTHTDHYDSFFGQRHTEFLNGEIRQLTKTLFSVFLASGQKPPKYAYIYVYVSQPVDNKKLISILGPVGAQGIPNLQFSASGKKARRSFFGQRQGTSESAHQPVLVDKKLELRVISVFLARGTRNSSLAIQPVDKKSCQGFLAGGQ